MAPFLRVRCHSLALALTRLQRAAGQGCGVLEAELGKEGCLQAAGTGLVQVGLRGRACKVWAPHHLASTFQFPGLASQDGGPWPLGDSAFSASLPTPCHVPAPPGELHA